jgi:hypothetical protein
MTTPVEVESIAWRVPEPVEEPSDAYGLIAEFDSASALLDAARQAHAAGYSAMDAYSPFPVEGLAEALEAEGTSIPLVTLIGGVVGAIAGYGLQYFVHVISLPINVGGRPLNSWQAFVPVTFEMSVLFAALFTLAALMIANRLPEPYHPVFNVDAFARASRDRFFLCIETRDPRFHHDATRALLLSLGAREVTDVPR